MAEDISSEQSPLASSVAPTLTRALEVFGDSHKAVGWLESAHPALAGKTPLQILDEGGFETVDNLLMRVAHGIPS